MVQVFVAVKKKSPPSGSWLVLDATGKATVLDPDKYAIMHRVQIHARDLDPFLSYPSTILGFEFGVQHIKAFITAQEANPPFEI